MIGKIFGVLTVISVIFGVLNGKTDEVSQGALSGAGGAVELCVSMLGAVCLWSGVARVLEKAGFSVILQRTVSPILKRLYPKSADNPKGLCACAANISANFLGLGNAALPAGLSAIKELQGEGEVASDDAVMLAVLATTPFQLIPTTLAAMREAAGSASPYEVLVPIWICEILTTLFAVIVCKLLAKVCK